MLQGFMKVYAMLREELAQDPLLGSQTDAARQWLIEVCGASACVRTILFITAHAL